ncbi:hypothetical protein QYE76_040362 [Lolium multiflorum]|uniref:Reverse transcriptase/retrotransposon-derived protein RNase H-like domain-containing protein n=1 Tax=Lolium multiflorum TaxID=4521 RepID=A0AAD8TCX5_LOLMU|nr:hypothetical protein QYE76_040362 [Lolium multiflorum]
MSTFRRNFLFSALKPLLRDSTQCLEVDGILDLRAGGPHRPGTISSGLYRKGKTSAVGAMERKATTHVGSWLSLSCVPSPAKQVGTSRFRAEAMGNENSAPPAAGAWPDLQHKKRNATAELGGDRPGTETLGPLLKRKIKTAADQAASMLMPPPSSKCLYKHKATHQLGGDLLMNMETAAPLLKWMQNGANEAVVRTMVPAPSSENLYKHEAMGQLGGDLLMNLDETSVPLLKWIKNDPDEAAVKTMVRHHLLKTSSSTRPRASWVVPFSTETAKPSLVKRIATAADEASAEAATKLLSAPPSGCLYKLKSKDQPGRNHPRKLPKSISKDLNAGRRGKISLVMESEGLTVEGRYLSVPQMAAWLLLPAFSWDEEATTAFAALWRALTTGPVLQMSDLDMPLVVDCDASGIGFGTVLHQGEGPLTFFSRPFAARHHKLAAYECELIGLVQARLSTVPQHQWISKLFGFDFTVEYRPGRLNTDADALSCRDSEDVTDDVAAAGTILCMRSGPSFAFIDDIRRATSTVADA